MKFEDSFAEVEREFKETRDYYRVMIAEAEKLGDAQKVHVLLNEVYESEFKHLQFYDSVVKLVNSLKEKYPSCTRDLEEIATLFRQSKSDLAGKLNDFAVDTATIKI